MGLGPAVGGVQRRGQGLADAPGCAHMSAAALPADRPARCGHACSFHRATLLTIPNSNAADKKDNHTMQSEAFAAASLRHKRCSLDSVCPQVPCCQGLWRSSCTSNAVSLKLLTTQVEGKCPCIHHFKPAVANMLQWQNLCICAEALMMG